MELESSSNPEISRPFLHEFQASASTRNRSRTASLVLTPDDSNSQSRQFRSVSEGSEESTYPRGKRRVSFHKYGVSAPLKSFLLKFCCLIKILVPLGVLITIGTNIVLFKSIGIVNRKVWPVESTLATPNNINSTMYSAHLRNTKESKFSGSFPKVYILPIPEVFNEDLRRHCSLWKKSFLDNPQIGQQRLIWYFKTAFNPIRTVGNYTPETPFGYTEVLKKACTNKCSKDSEANITISVKNIPEYDQDVHFHRMLLGWRNRVRTIDEADLVYIPIYYRWRLGCSKEFNSEEGLHELLRRFGDIVRKPMELYPEKVFFVVNGGICSCPNDMHVCNPLYQFPKLRQRLRIAAWEKHPGDPNGVVIPYLSNIHNVRIKDPFAERKYSIFYAGTTRNYTTCIQCGPCSSGFETCPLGCYNIRNIIKEQIERQVDQIKNHKDILYIDPSTQSTGRSIFRGMLSSTFCLQPSGDSLTRKGFYDSILLGCIPVVFRDDFAFKEQLAFSTTIPYSDIYMYINEQDILNGIDILKTLQEVPLETIRKKQETISKYQRRLLFAKDNSRKGGYNDFDNPDAFNIFMKEMLATSGVHESET